MEIQDLYKIYKSYPLVCTDSRKVVKDCLFFALKGENFNGNQFTKDAIKKGAKYVIIDEKEFLVSNQCILVKDVLTTLQELANYHRKQLNIPFIGITGTNGKTTTKELINAVLSKKYKTIATQGNFNNHIGVPLTILQITLDCEMAIIEMGANHIGEIKFLCQIAEPNHGIITNIGTAHIEGFGSKEGVIKTKNELYQFIKEISGKVFVNNTDDLLMNLAKDINHYTYGNSNANCKATMVKSSPFVQVKWNNQLITSQLYGKYNFDNIIAAICIGDFFNVSASDITEAIEEYTPTNNRSEIVKINSNTFYLDAYNANPSSMKAAIETFSENDAQNKYMILGDMLELGNTTTEEHQKIVDSIKELNIDTLFVGNAFNNIKNKYHFCFVSNYDEAIKHLIDKNTTNTHILIKGSRGIQLEKITAYFQTNPL
ncbi:MAG: UDP-N-acetylmuramoyl-tripeptide--D-alanyl-D-alanine ligase [Vicingus serpentipes]|nr:UDP-N-acetylmuramoyl-tripeptide--D-alanyl-D-alanine ligase [Vicingus serpentipes]